MSDAATISEDARPDDGSGSEDERYGLIKEAFQGLVRKCGEMSRHEDRREELENPETLSREEIAARKAVLVELHTELMPALKRKLTSLLAAVFLDGSIPTDNPNPEPLLGEILEILSDFGPSLDYIRASIVQLAPWTHTHSRMFSHRDQAYGQLKKFRCDRLVNQFDSSICINLREIFKSYIRCLEDHLYHSGVSNASWLSWLGEKSEACCREVEQWIQIATGSDFRVLQADWQDDWHSLQHPLKTLHASLELVGKAAGSNRRSPMLLALYHLFTDTERLAALAVKFYMTVMTSRCLITFPDNLSTNELEWVFWRTSRLTPFINRMAESLTELFKREYPMHVEILRTRQDRDLITRHIRSLKVAAFKLQRSLDAGLALICFHHLPSPVASLNHPPSENLYRSLFYETRSQWSHVMRKYRNHLRALRRLINP
ncbi:hypothetical protein VP01_1586g1 [Puccinia sorghi]|uniref:Uncharacterized protein n=1 Tax=Puccinia sorghi TaxID=27349 RepID=A0A0L6VI56_9BASI|nr:hypothetical protein VP01_1586g1 [Puccinia sorghi]